MARIYRFRSEDDGRVNVTVKITKADVLARWDAAGPDEWEAAARAIAVEATGCQRIDKNADWRINGVAPTPTRRETGETATRRTGRRILLAGGKFNGAALDVEADFPEWIDELERRLRGCENAE